MRFKVETSHDDVRNKRIRFEGEISDRDLMQLRLTGFDRKIVEDCRQGSTSDDWLLALEIIFRRHREQNEAKKVKV